MTVRTRFEPSPSGSIHVGTALVASFNWYLARKHGGRFVLRVADTDASRVVPEGLRSVVEDLRWLGLTWDEGPEVGGPHEPYFQSQRGDLYRAAAARLVEQGQAYRCYCTPEELEAMRERARAAKRPPRYEGRCRDLGEAERAAFEAEGRSSVIRFRVPEGSTTVEDLVRGEVTFAHAELQDFVILRADGSALYQLAVSYDDMEMEITHVIRGEDIFASTPNQVLLMRAMGAERTPSYGHVPLIVGPDRRPLGKRHGDTAIAEFRDHGFLPEVILNYLATLNWSVGDGSREKFSVEELIQAFDPSGVTRNPSAFDYAKLEAWNGDGIRALAAEDLCERLVPYLAAEGIDVTPFDPRLRAIVPHIHERMRRLNEAAEQIRFLFQEVEPDEKALGQLTPETVPLLRDATVVAEAVDRWVTEALTGALMTWADGSGISRKKALQPIRAAITGRLVSPPLFESMEVLGRERSLARLHGAVERASAGAKDIAEG
ncbi:MAG TPA: glutamate--tRNA ligase [Actinomycetota bacterium]